MNSLQYKIENYFYEKAGHYKLDLHTFSMQYYDLLNQAYQKVHHEDLNFEPIFFEKLITQIYNVLKLRLTEEEWFSVMDHYLYQLTGDCVMGFNKVDFFWCIDKIYYFATWSVRDTTKKYVDDLLFLQDQLYKEFQLEENFKQKMERKVKMVSFTKI